MLTLAYSVYDNKALVYAPPFFAPTDGYAVRLFSDLVNDPGTSVNRHPGDFALFQVGTYDDGHGALLAVSPLRHVIDAAALVMLQKQLPLERAIVSNTDGHINGEAG